MIKRIDLGLLLPILTIFTLLLVFQARGADKTAYSCYFTSEPLTIDGQLTETAWQKAPVLAFYVPPTGGKPLSPTEGRVLWDRRYLYVSFKAYDKDIMGTLTQRDSATFKEDVLEIFFKPLNDNDSYYNFEINALGTVYDALNDKSMAWRNRKKWDSRGLLVKITMQGAMNDNKDQDKYWQMEVAVPFEDLEILKGQKPSPGDTWLFHLARYDYSSYLPEGKELSSCAPLTEVNFHKYADWLPLKFLQKKENPDMVYLREPDVLKTPLPQTEPICRVGITLEQDNKNRMEMVLPPGKYKIDSQDQSTTIISEKPTTLTLETREDFLFCKKDQGAELLKTGGFITLSPPERTETLAPGAGIILKGAVVGRGFHWQKEVDLSFPYSLEIHHRNGKLIIVNVVPMETYLTCVVTSEMSAECPPEFIKAQATAARSWMLVFLKNKHIDEPFYICNDDCCQRYQGTTHLSPGIARCVSDTRGMCIVTKDNTICGAYYSKCCGGIMERAQNIFGTGAVGISKALDAPQNSITGKYNPVTEENIREWVCGDFLVKSDSFCSPNTCPEDMLPKYLGAVDQAGKYYRWNIAYSLEELQHYLREKAGISDLGEFLDFRAGKRGNSGRLHELVVIYKDRNGDQKEKTIKTQYQIRNALHEKFLFSSAFVWDIQKDTHGKIEKIVLQGSGWGHGVGLCQMGALGMALQGYSYEKILKHYYNTSKLVMAY